jgi:hypothetical protein
MEGLNPRDNRERRMAELEHIRATPSARAYIIEIAELIRDRYNISHAQAISEVGSFWSSQQFVSEAAQIALFHRTPEDWAERIHNRMSKS